MTVFRRAPTVAFVGAKGGTLKTASVAAVAHLFAKIGLRTVMVDGDPQGSLTKRSGFARVPEPLVAAPVLVEYEGEPPLDLHLIRGGRANEALDMDTARAHIEGAYALAPDVVVIDTPPALGPITLASIGLSDVVVVPAQPGIESLEGLIDILPLAGRAGVPVRVLMTMVHPKSNLLRWMVKQLDEHAPGTRMGPIVPFEMASGESALFSLPVTVSAPRSRGGEAYCVVAGELAALLALESVAARGAA
jgi:chromosome partitioning protein